MSEDKDPPVYHVFRRTSDVVLTVFAIIVALIAVFKWFYMKPLTMETSLSGLQEKDIKQDERIDDNKDEIENLKSELDATNRRLSEFQKSFKVGGYGHWTLRGNGWVWIPDKEREKIRMR